MRLFISHASEDKERFVRPLAERLRALHDVWYDEYELKVGDSLRERIDEGLRSSDHGIVVLSPNFFAKDWPRRELDGLFQLEDQTRKVILPVWLDVSVSDVRKFSPILAGRVAAKAEQGLDAVVNALTVAIDASARQRRFAAVTAATERLLQVGQALHGKRQSTDILTTERGVELVTAAMKTICDEVKNALSRAAAGSPLLRFGFNERHANTFVVHAPFSLNLRIGFKELHLNSARSARLTVSVYRWDELRQSADFFQELEYRPVWREGDEILWESLEDEHCHTCDDVVANAIAALTEEIARHGEE